MPPKPHHHRKPKPHRGRKADSGRMLATIIVGVGLTVFVAAVMYWYGVPVNTILPTSAPILIGSITLAFMAQARD